MNDENNYLLTSIRPGMSCKELESSLSGIGDVEFIKVLRDVYKHKFVHFGLAIVKFKDQYSYSTALGSDKTTTGFHFMELKKYLLSDTIGLIFGLPKLESVECYSKVFIQNGAQAVIPLDAALGSDPYVLLVSFVDKRKMKSFQRIIEGLIVSGNRIMFVQLKITPYISFSARFQYLSLTLADRNNFDFTLIHYGDAYQCWSGAAIGLSQLIAKAYENDPSITSFEVPHIPGPFSILYSHFLGESVTITPSNAAFLLIMSQSLEIKSLHGSIESFLGSLHDPLSLVALLSGFHSLNYNPPRFISEVAASFIDVKDAPVFRALPQELLSLIVSCPSLIIESEDMFFDWVMGFNSLCLPKFLALVSFIKFERLSNDRITQFLSLPSSIVDLNDFRVPFLRIKNQIEYNPQIDDQGSRAFKYLFEGISIQFNEENYLRGIIHYFRENPIFNINGMIPIKVTASTTNHSDPSVLISGKTNEWFGTGDYSLSWIRVQFLSCTVSINGYSLVTHNSEGNGHIVSWRISGSNNGSNWDVIHNVNTCATLSKIGAHGSFKLDSPSKSYSFFEICQTKPNSMNYNNLRLSQIEFFGQILP